MLGNIDNRINWKRGSNCKQRPYLVRTSRVFWLAEFNLDFQRKITAFERILTSAGKWPISCTLNFGVQLTLLSAKNSENGCNPLEYLGLKFEQSLKKLQKTFLRSVHTVLNSNFDDSQCPCTDTEGCSFLGASPMQASPRSRSRLSTLRESKSFFPLNSTFIKYFHVPFSTLQCFWSSPNLFYRRSRSRADKAAL